MKRAFYVLYVDSNEPELKRFDTKSKAQTFIARFQKGSGHTRENGYWVDLVFKGKVIDVAEHIRMG